MNSWRAWFSTKHPSCDTQHQTDQRCRNACGCHLYLVWCRKNSRGVIPKLASVGDNHTPNSHPWCDVSNMATIRAVCSRLFGSQIAVRQIPSVNIQDSRVSAVAMIMIDHLHHKHAPVRGGIVTSRSAALILRADPHLPFGKLKDNERGAFVTTLSIA